MKEIPKREGQKLTGLTVSAFALAFLLFVVPFVSTYLISVATYFGNDPLVEGYTKSDALLGPYPFYEKSGDGPDAKCDAGELSYSSSNCTASLSTFSEPGSYPIQEVLDHEAVWHQGLTGCAETGNYGSSMFPDCGDSDYRISQNITQIIDNNRIFPSVYLNYTNSQPVNCDWSRMGESKVDYTISFKHYKRDPIFAGTSIWTYGYVDESLELKGTHRFNSSLEATWSSTTTEGLLPGYDDLACHNFPGGCATSSIPAYYYEYITTTTCNTYRTIQVYHEMDFLEVEGLNDLLEHWRDTEGDNESFGIYMTIEMDNLRTRAGSSWSSKNYHNPFHGDNDSRVQMTFELVTYDIDPINTYLRFGVLGMGIGFWVIAIASTPYWDPLIKRQMGVKK